jgi:hypothetical protein
MCMQVSNNGCSHSSSLLRLQQHLLQGRYTNLAALSRQRP